MKTPCSVTAIRWARPIRQTHWLVLCALITLTALTENGTHGSDSVESAAREIAYFFGEGEVCPRTR